MPCQQLCAGGQHTHAAAAAPAARHSLCCLPACLQLDALCPASNFVLEDNVMEATLLPFNLAGNPILHPGIMYARWHDYK